MKTINKLIFFALTIVFFSACKQNYIDEISKVDPGADATAPQIIVNFPPDGYKLQTNDEVASINIDFEVRDDIEVASVVLKMDGTEISSYNEFKDYRVVLENYLYDNVTTGTHVLSVVATDTDGKTTTTDVNFTKAPPYVPLYDGEVFYMPFNSEYREMNSLELATVVGTPGFGEGIQGGTAYTGATGSYLTFPTAGITGTSFSAVFWYKVDVSPDRAGILNASIAGEDRTKGFRLFREGNATAQRIKLNVGTGSGETWNDGQEFDATTGEWVHIAFTISTTNCVIYINGELAADVANTGIDWTGCDAISIGSGAPNFTYWGHDADLSQYDELRMFNKALTQEEIQTIMLKEQATFYMNFNGEYKDAISGSEATVVGSPDFSYNAGIEGDAYAGAASSYLTFPIDGLTGSSFSAAFWYKVNPTPDRSGILNASITGEDRTKGFRLFREGSTSLQRIKLNVGTGSGETWNDGQEIDATTGDWVHLAFTISSTNCIIYINGVATDVTNTGIDWTGCDAITIGSGAPNFTYWGHDADLSLYDELRFFNKALTPEEVTLLMNDSL